ncbi:solute carrier organic anion transporter family member 4C1-like [Amphiura filiformis]|uniref:solute carrier organic anion transporter family member 4C1-like n=1 Tax=Amphiura filiformis TaxID=82378 RepID=UPI003B21E0E1
MHQQSMASLYLSGLALSSGLSINGLTNVAITSIEKRFELSSSQTALIPIMYEISSSVLIIVIGYFFAHGNKPRWIASGGIIVTVGCFVFALPHFLTGIYVYEGSGGNITNVMLCPNENNATSCEANESIPEARSISRLSKYLYVFMVGQILMGVGNAPANALQTVYLDESVKAKNIGIYLGIQGAVTNLASAIGFIAGGIILEVLFTDYIHVDTKTLGLSPSDPQWVGAWWLGFLFCAAGALVFAIFISCFPPQMPGFEIYRKERQGQEQKVTGLERASQPGFGITFRDIPAATLVLFRNPLYLFIMFTNISDISFLAGAEVFLPKFLELQFALSAGDAAITVGVIATVFGTIALLFGGWLIKKFDLKVRGMLKVCLGSNIACAFLLFTTFLRCPEIPLAGFSVPYDTGEYDTGEYQISNNLVDLEAQCNSYCNCSTTKFNPVCSSEGITYFSACHAGCEVFDQQANQYSNCSCISVTPEATNQTFPNSAVSGACGGSCVQFYIFAGCLSGLVFFYLLTGAPRTNVLLRCVPHRLRSYANALNSLIVRSLGKFEQVYVIRIQHW